MKNILKLTAGILLFFVLSMLPPLTITLEPATDAISDPGTSIEVLDNQVPTSEAGSVFPYLGEPDPSMADIPQEGIYSLMLDSSLGPLTYYNQGDARWGEYLYGGKDRMARYGCGPTVMATLITSLTGEQVLPPALADWAAANGCWCPAQGSYHCLIQDSATAFGLTVYSLKDYSADAIRETLNSGHLIVALMKKGHFTGQGHFIILTHVTEEGSIRIADCNNFENTKYDWDPATIINELNTRAKNGGPLWVIGLPEVQP